MIQDLVEVYLTPDQPVPNPFSARCVFFHGPLALYVHQSTRKELETAYAKLGDYLAVAIDQFEAAGQAVGALPLDLDDRGRGPRGEGS